MISGVTIASLIPFREKCPAPANSLSFVEITGSTDIEAFSNELRRHKIEVAILLDRAGNETHLIQRVNQKNQREARSDNEQEWT